MYTIYSNFGEASMYIGKVFIIFTIYLALTINVTAAEKKPPDVTVDGLYRINDTKMALVYAKPDVDLSQYDRIYLIQPQVAFVKNWLRDQNRVHNQVVRSEDMERIKSELAVLFFDIFKAELQDKGGYVLVEEVAEDVLVVQPAIIDLDIIAPDTPGTSGMRSLYASVGSMLLYMELIDSVTGDKIVKVLDNKQDFSHRNPNVRNRVRNEKAAREMLGEWAELLRLGLDEARMVVK